MNWDIISGKWDQLKADVRAQWAKLTDDDVSAVGARKDKLIGILQQRYGILKHEAEQQIDSWLEKFDQHTGRPPRPIVP
jgi:uncharacterized protein YjbJ (UPF0337 family)